MLKQKTFIAILIKFSGSILGIVSVFFVAHYMGPEALGIINTSLAFVSLFIIVGDFGFGLAHIKRVSEGYNIGNCISTFKRIKFVLTVLMGLSAVITLYVIKYFTGSYPLDEKYLPIFYIILASSMLTNYFNFIPNTFSAKIETTKEGIIVVSNKFFVSLFRIIAAMVGLSVIYLAWGTLFGAIISIFVSLFLFRKYPRGKFEKDIFISYKKYAIPSLAVLVISVVLIQLDKLFLAYFCDVKEVGYYTGAQGFAMILTFISSVFLGLLMPTYSSLFSENKIEEIKSLAYRVERYISLLIMPIGVFMIIFSDEIRLIVLGLEFSKSSNIIAVLIMGAMFAIFSQPYSSQLLGAGLIKKSVKIGIIVLVTDVVLNIILIPDSILGINLFGLGGLGAAISMAIATFIGALLGRYYAFKTTNSKPNYKILLHLIVALIPFLALKYFSIEELIGLNIIVTLIIIALTGSLLYLVILWLIGDVKKVDLTYYISILSPSLMKKYFKSEFSNESDK